MALAFIDTNVLVCCFDDADPAKRDRARAWIATCWEARCGRLSTQVLNEFYSVVRRKFTSALSAGDARAEIRRYQAWQPWAIDHATVETAWAVEARCGLNYWDALIVASAQATGCSFFISEAMQHEQRIDKLQIINPFLASPELLAQPT